MRGEQFNDRRRGVGHLIDMQGNTAYHLVSSTWTNLVILGFGLLLAALVIMMIFTLTNKTKIDDLQRQITEDEILHHNSNTNTNTGDK